MSKLYQEDDFEYSDDESDCHEVLSAAELAKKVIKSNDKHTLSDKKTKYKLALEEYKIKLKEYEEFVEQEEKTVKATIVNKQSKAYQISLSQTISAIDKCINKKELKKIFKHKSDPDLIKWLEEPIKLAISEWEDKKLAVFVWNDKIDEKVIAEPENFQTLEAFKKILHNKLQAKIENIPNINIKISDLYVPEELEKFFARKKLIIAKTFENKTYIVPTKPDTPREEDFDRKFTEASPEQLERQTTKTKENKSEVMSDLLEQHKERRRSLDIIAITEAKPSKQKENIPPNQIATRTTTSVISHHSNYLGLELSKRRKSLNPNTPEKKPTSSREIIPQAASTVEISDIIAKGEIPTPPPLPPQKSKVSNSSSKIVQRSNNQSKQNGAQAPDNIMTELSKKLSQKRVDNGSDQNTNTPTQPKNSKNSPKIGNISASPNSTSQAANTIDISSIIAKGEIPTPPPLPPEKTKASNPSSNKIVQRSNNQSQQNDGASSNLFDVKKAGILSRFFSSLWSSKEKRFLAGLLRKNDAKISLGTGKLVTGIPFMACTGTATGFSAFMLVTGTSFGLGFLTAPILIGILAASAALTFISFTTNVSACIDKVSLPKSQEIDANNQPNGFNMPELEQAIETLGKYHFNIEKAKTDPKAFLKQYLQNTNISHEPASVA